MDESKGSARKKWTGWTERLGGSNGSEPLAWNASLGDAKRRTFNGVARWETTAFIFGILRGRARRG